MTTSNDLYILEIQAKELLHQLRVLSIDNSTLRLEVLKLRANTRYLRRFNNMQKSLFPHLF